MKIILASLALLLTGAGLHAGTTINATNSFAYGANIGWLNWRGNVDTDARQHPARRHHHHTRQRDRRIAPALLPHPGISPARAVTPG